MVKRAYAVGLICGVLLCGCAGFAYKYYGLDGVSYADGVLMGPSPKYDRAFSDCAPNAQSKHPCVVMFTPEFNEFKKDYGQCKAALKDCQNPPQGTE